ncbi:hypothetical protein [Leptospira stimsonii]|uniref:DUF1508 domain-containing protein n=1 Tax=Leptospira stimsonii TaxID=2202203 RepID=A0ABY2N5L1_9LEPT|nr:hypothetical protein [Leptospira stimsonii]TGK12940.1 hypothetical protein EHO98_19245 [Leptospira stimsonii]TGM17457.1 hypothetical protein EHQ90_06995 [Leptospira stimsonii]
MLKVTKEEILKKLVSVSSGSIKRIEAVEWARPIAETYPLNLINLNDVVLEEAFKTLQISTLKMNELATEYCKNDDSYFIRKDDYDYWIGILNSKEISEINISEELKIADPRQKFTIAENPDCQVNLTSSEFSFLSGINDRRSFDDLYYNSYVRFWFKGKYEFYIRWDMNNGYKSGSVYSNFTNSNDAIDAIKKITNRSDIINWKNDFKLNANSD